MVPPPCKGWDAHELSPVRASRTHRKRLEMHLSRFTLVAQRARFEIARVGVVSPVLRHVASRSALVMTGSGAVIPRAGVLSPCAASVEARFALVAGRYDRELLHSGAVAAGARSELACHRRFTTRRDSGMPRISP